MFASAFWYVFRAVSRSPSAYVTVEGFVAILVV